MVKRVSPNATKTAPGSAKPPDTSNEDWAAEDIVTVAQFDDRDESDSRISPATDSLVRRLESRSGEDSGLELLDEIGHGGMGTVTRVRDEILRRHLAMKVMKSRPDGNDGGHRLGRFLEEAQVTAQLDHPGIVPVHSLGVDDQGQVYFTMKLVRGRDLQEIIKLAQRDDERWSKTRILHILLRACEALAFAHRKGVIHRDLKPANIMVGRYGETYVMDWGLARVRDGRAEETDSSAGSASSESNDAVLSAISSDRKKLTDDEPLTIDGQVLGTPAYMAPEQASANHSDVGTRSDVYSMGAILYHLLSGRAPYQPEDTNLSPYLVLRFVVEGPPTPLRELSPSTPPELISICEKAMARRPEARYGSMEAFGDDLRAFLEQRVVRAYAVGAGAEFKKWVSRNRSSAWIAAAALLTIVLVTGTFLVHLNARAETAEQLRADADEARLLTFASLAAAEPFVLKAAEAKLSELWPIHPRTEPAILDWIRSTEGTRNRASTYREYLDGTPDPEMAARCVSAIDAIGAFERLGDNPGPFEVAQRRLARSRGLRRESIDDHQEDWEYAIKAIADPEESPAYGGLKITPQLGLVPLGPDPESGLWEFWHVLTGERPTRGDDDRWIMTEPVGVVLVLLPGGPFLMGAQSYDAEDEHFDPLASDDESYDIDIVELDPFFLSKHELTQSQWRKMERIDADADHSELAMSASDMTWHDCFERLPRLQLSLPTEAQWEYAARAGTHTPWGIEFDALDTTANLSDSAFSDPSIRFDPRLNDGYKAFAPVGMLAPNQFGLHDMLGNVMEWTHDHYSESAYYLTPEPGTGLREVLASQRRVVRGGSSATTPDESRVSTRHNGDPSKFTLDCGLRPARQIDI